MIQPSPHKLICPKCNYTKIVRPQSDSLNIMDMVDICPKCGGHMKHTKMSNRQNIFRNLFNRLFGKSI